MVSSHSNIKTMVHDLGVINTRWSKGLIDDIDMYWSVKEMYPDAIYRVHAIITANQSLEEMMAVIAVMEDSGDQRIQYMR